MIATGVALALIAGGILAYARHARTGNDEPSQMTPVTQETRKPPLEVKKILVLVYHSVAPAPLGAEGPMNRHYRVSPDNFDRQMKYLVDHGYQTIRFDTYADYLLHDIPIPKKPIVITFDDGLENQYTYAAPVLKKYGFVATFFVYPGVTGHKRFMTESEIKELSDAGHEIASHTYIHENLPKLTDPNIIHRELVTSKELLEKMTGKPVTTIAYPFYAQNELTGKWVRDAGYVAARAGWQAFENSADTIFQLKAQEVVDGANPFASK